MLYTCINLKEEKKWKKKSKREERKKKWRKKEPNNLFLSFLYNLSINLYTPIRYSIRIIIISSQLLSKK